MSVTSSKTDMYERRLGLKMLEYLYGKKTGSKIASANREEGDRVSAYKIQMPRN
jgi:hypothetical protein